ALRGAVATPDVMVRSKVDLPFDPVFVVMIITPLAPLEPYMAVDEASFKMSTDAMSAGFMAWAFRWSVGNPSTTHKGCVPAVIDPNPRMETVPRSPGDADLCAMLIPGISPWIPSSILLIGLREISSAFTDAMEPVTSF